MAIASKYNRLVFLSSIKEVTSSFPIILMMNFISKS